MAKVELGTAYEINKELWKQITQPTEEVIRTQLASLCSWLSSNYKNHYYMLLCREKNDYTIFYIKQSSYYELGTEVKEVLESRGTIIDISYSHKFGFYECWIKEHKINEDDEDEYSMYAFFPCDNWVVEVE